MPPKLPLPFTDLQTQLPVLSLDPSDLLLQTASISYQPFCHKPTMHRTDRQQTDQQMVGGMSDDYRPLSLYRWQSRQHAIHKHTYDYETPVFYKNDLLVHSLNSQQHMTSNSLPDQCSQYCILLQIQLVQWQIYRSDQTQ